MKASTWHAQRDDQIAAAVDAGEDVEVVAAQYGLTVTRIRQIYREAFPEKQKPNPRRIYTPELAQGCLERWESGDTYASIAKDIGVSPATVMNWVGSLRMRRADAANRRAWREPLTDSERYRINSLLFDALRTKNWDLVKQARETVGEPAFTAYEEGLRRAKPR